MLWRGSLSLPEGQAKCRPCRKRDREIASRLGPVHGPWLANQCDGCGANTHGRTCDECKSDRAKARYRHKAHMRRVVSKLTDLTPSVIRDMRGAASHCPMPGCGIAMSDDPLLLNSKELDHIRPVVSGGTHVRANVRIICRKCNRARPHDGSDYDGELPAEAVDLEVATAYVMRIAQEREARKAMDTVVKPEPYAAQRLMQEASHRLRNEGLTWQQVADELGYASPGAAYTAANLYRKRAAQDA